MTFVQPLLIPVEPNELSLLHCGAHCSIEQQGHKPCKYMCTDGPCVFVLCVLFDQLLLFTCYDVCYVYLVNLN